jgi:putative oxidoreductase
MYRIAALANFYYRAARWPEYLAPAFDLGLRLFLANVFFKSGLTKLQTWDGTLYLFNEVYDVPLLPPEVAVWLATGAELGLSVMLAFGLLGRFAAAGLFILNGVAVISYSELSESGLSQHLHWGLLLGVLLMLSRSPWSLDALLEKRLQA